MSIERASSLSRDGRPQAWRQTVLAAVAAAVLVAAAGFLLVARGEPLASASGGPAAGGDSNGRSSRGGAPPGAAAQERPSPPPQPEEALALQHPFPNRFPAPGLEGGTGWLNTSGEITLRDLRGKVVLLDFWTYCCINCIHVLPDLEFLERKYPRELVVIGVHSAKFDNEKDSENIRRAIQRYEIAHPVINDSEMTLWRKFGARAWPTLVVIDAEGQYCGYVSGEGKRELLDEVVSRLVAYHRARGTLDTTPVRFDLELDKLESTPLRFPAKVLADEAGGRLFISDSNHNRIVIATLDGRLLDVVGSGAIGAGDGGYAEATFDHPHGMTLAGDVLYVADTENHLIRQVDLSNRSVRTLAGTGTQSPHRRSGGKLLETPLNSPWALAHVDGVLFIAMAGPHQIWRHTLGSDAIEVHAGTGREDILNGPLLEAALAQPSGMVSDGEFLYVCDSEGSAVRKISVDPAGSVETVVGPSDLALGRALFEFGDTDGIGARVRLQHPLGIALHRGTLYVADSYNHKIKRIDLKTARARTWLGNGKRGDRLDPPQFSEPAGLAIANGKLYIADTNNHRVSTADLETGRVEVLSIAGLEPPAPPAADESRPAAAKPIELPKQVLAAGTELRFEIAPKLPRGYKLNKLFPHTYRLSVHGEQALVPADRLDSRQEAPVQGERLVIAVPLARASGGATYELAVTYGYCRGGTGGLCKIQTVRWRVPIEFAEGGSPAVRLAPVPE
ncbi:MAG TPA: thioredoxin-like domain-containing protein [Planctomycetaceae bacterium]|nr:thioredoxin-like domain-containing protein [Planctomycetaceae bacterium]